MRLGQILWVLAAFGVAQTAVADQLYPSSYGGGLGQACLAPIEAFPYRLEKSDPLYETARDDHQRYLEELEDYVNCLDRERSGALAELRGAYELFGTNFGRDAVLRYSAERETRRQ